MDFEVDGAKGDGAGESNSPGCSGYSSMVHSKKVIKHALRQQAKRRRKNTTIAAGNSRALPRIVVKPLPPPPPDDPPSPPPSPSPMPVNNIQHTNSAEEPAVTMREVLASLPGFSLKGRRRSTKRLSAAAQLEAGLVDLESPASILASTSLRALLNRHTFQGLPPLYQRKLAQLLPGVDRQDAATSGLNNEFFARACLEWRKRLAEGEFTPENQQRLKMEAERDKNKLDPWKLKHFEPIWGEKREPRLRSGLQGAAELRSAGAVTRSSLRLRLESNPEQTAPELIPSPVSGALVEKMEGNTCITETNLDNSEAVSDSREMQQDSPHEYQGNVQILEDEYNMEDSTKQESTVMIVELRTDPKIPPVEQTVQIPEERHVPHIPEVQIPQIPEQEISQIPEEEVAPISDGQIPRISVNQITLMPEDQIEMSEDHISQMSEEHISETSEEHISQMSEGENNPVAGGASPCEDVRVSEQMSESPAAVNSQEEGGSTTTTADREPQIPEEMEIDSETLQRIHELEVRGEMREAYEEISGCPEEIIYPILEGIEMGTNVSEETESQGVPGQGEDSGGQREINGGNVEDAFIDANNYVLESSEIRSEMLECSWAVDQTVTTVGNANRTQEDLQVPWPLVTAALDTVAANITVTTQDECADTSPPIETSIAQQTVNLDDNAVDAINHAVQMPVVHGSSFQRDALAVGTSVPISNCLLNNVQSQSPPIIAFPQLQSIRFVQTSFHPSQNSTQTLPNTNANPIPVQIQNQRIPSPQIGIVRSQEEVARMSSQNVLSRNNLQNNVIPRSQTQSNPTPVCVQNQVRAQNSSIVVQHQAPIPAQPRQMVATVQQQQQQQQQQYPAAVTVSSRSARSTGQGGGQRGSRGGNKEQGGGRSRSSTKEPPGAVNLERSYQICQAVIQNSPNRDQLKAHLKPPPSLLARGDGAFTTGKHGGRTVTTVKTHKAQPAMQHGKQPPNKAQALMLRHVFATARQAIPTEVTENGTVAQLGPNGTSNLGQYILVQRTGVGDGAPRASSAPPLPPQIAGMGVGVHLVRGRPASAGEGSHHAVTLKARGALDGRGGGGAEPGAPGVIMGGDPPPPCECNMRGAMVICRQCGAFCHDDCIGPQRICATCLIR